MNFITNNNKCVQNKTIRQRLAVCFGSSSIHADSLLHNTGNITEKYHYLKAFADLDCVQNTASLISSFQQENRAERTNTLPNPCWSQRSQEMKRKSKVSPPKSVMPHLSLPLAVSFSPFSPHTLPSHLKNGVTFATLEEKKKSVVSACLKVLINFRKSLQVTLHLSSLSGIYPVHSMLGKLKNYPD